MRRRYFILRTDRDRETKVGREPFEILPSCANNVTLRAWMLDVEDVWVGLVRFQPEGVRVEFSRRFHVLARQSAVGESLRHVSATGKSLRRIRHRPMGCVYTAGFASHRLFAQGRLVTFDFPAVGSRLEKIERVRTVVK